MTENDDIQHLVEALDAAAAPLENVEDPEADAEVDDALEIDSAEEADAAVEALLDEVEAADGDEAVAEAVEAEAVEVDPYEDFKLELRAKPGRWYVVHSYAGFEKSVKQNIENRRISLGMEDSIYEIQVPMEDVVEIKNGQRKLVNRVRIPSYVLVRMDLNEDSWSAVRHTPGVTGFVGNAHNPVPLRFDEAFGMLKSLVQVAEAPAAAGKTVAGKGGKAATRVIPAEIDYEVGETITIKEGSFAGLPGTIDAIDAASGKLTVLVSLFERETPVTLGFEQVTKL
ncbi:MAG TPA: transcription termination/antitermination protein NusG [Microbacteriaceae bacterium]|nr:transcription termination/antitermination protein NusG [Microbacteriaceae bacterium]